MNLFPVNDREREGEEREERREREEREGERERRTEGVREREPPLYTVLPLI